MADEKIDRYELLKRMHERVEAAVFDPETPPRDLAALTRRLMEIGKEIESIDLQRLENGEGKPDAPADEPFDGSDV
ncbi:hypothetical protein SEA_NIKLAS_7 [Mycobacterium Phage Niklas]|uniref:Uncharacterized protein n=1 Tax=Mycobacterium Phage Niklas TaxID=2517936 RepID=A0A482JHC4_9CAUD|nr:terminase small subunit [Mycobacterium Phage Niklas]QAY02738.1 hypothetical protein SEA_SHAOBING_7 [Mycobacterium phage Shaobing]QBP31589.1 hypothetical protein SEA_NIKLAS_7 [Mycobacterium Phage Niklas]